ncbi:hypothetical protein [Microbacterium aurantiacum]|uniref:hypothetical protein n=1 Tax=Microbacterium aurantiacum TaxID=162393 RepID=UPI001F2B55AB|nr:hypothetical protein [Microbacterium aurantiacum]
MSSAPSRSDADPLRAALHRAADAVLDAVARLDASNPVIMIDGRSGAGKTTLARLIRMRWPRRERVQEIALDAMYPGWDGLDAGVDAAREQVLVPHARGLVGVWRRWDWELGEHAEAHAVDPALPLVIEGCGILTPATARLGDIRVWVEAPAAARKARALGRDGDAYRPHWERWARQEERHLRRDAPEALATHVIAVP